MTDTKTNLFTNCTAAKLHRDCDDASTGTDPLAIARVADIRAVLDERAEFFAVVRDMIDTPHSHETCPEGYYETCVFCGAAVEVEECAADCLRKRAETLLARMEAVTDA